ncbi:modular serine protease-like [Sitodiplosis mosellana]|uniref:modular serine protease-like n=1 Tax=Sitodiplosis mosellana TaxID=263140 RepID=UPI002444CA0D|nr:modular serine protease-like [Sitodiplosis mosellana]
MFSLALLTLLLSTTNILTQSEVRFICKSGHLLSGMEKVCNGHADCYDGSDELAELCARTLCPPEYFRCHYGACVHRSKKCNGVRDCVDSSDETNCGRKRNSCNPSEFNCGYHGDDTDLYRYCIDGSKICDGTLDCASGADENKTICENALCPESSFRCNYGGCVSESVLCDGFVDCLDGSDESHVLCITLKCPKCTNFIVTCPPLVENNIKSNRILKKCEWNGHQIPCTLNILPGTRVTYACKDHFKPKSPQDWNNDWNLCQADGTWLRDILECEPNCGQHNTRIQSIANESPLTMPWHASVFVVEQNQQPKYICGATLISEAVLVTAAHCVWKSNAKDLRISLGNVKTEYDDPDDFLARYYEVNEVKTYLSYLDQLSNYGSDIALIELTRRVDIDQIISPVCIDWDLDDITSQDTNDEIGITVSLKNSTSSSFLHVTKIPIVSHQKCVAKQPPEFRKYLTFSKFCAGWANGTSVCNGDSGSGLTVLRSHGRYFLKGIVSVSPRKKSTDQCDPNQYTVFTKVGIYVKWIENYLNYINERDNLLLSEEPSSQFPWK